MGFLQPDLSQARSIIARSLGEINSPYNDGWTASYCKQELYVLKCWLEDQYNQLPKFPDEETWEQRRMLEILKKD